MSETLGMSGIIHINYGGPVYYIYVRGKLRPFEMHSYFGPIPLHLKTLDPLEREPPGFWKSIEWWEMGGKRMEGNQCLIPPWCKSCEGTGYELEHWGGRNHRIIGPCQVCKGAKFMWTDAP